MNLDTIKSCVRFCILIFALGIITPLAQGMAVASARSTPLKLEGMEYLQARSIILNLGWKPDRGSCQGIALTRQICHRFPEIDECSGVGLGYCSMHFVRNGRILNLVTIGGPPRLDGQSDTVVRGVQFQ